MEINKYIGEKVKYYREINGLKQFELANLIGLNVNYLSRIEHGKVRVRLNVFIKMIEVLKITSSEFFRDY